MNKRLLNLGLGIAAMLAVLTAPVSACDCQHEDHDADSAYAKTSPRPLVTSDQTCLSDSDECTCPDNLPKIYAKAETVSLQQQVGNAAFILKIPDRRIEVTRVAYVAGPPLWVQKIDHSTAAVRGPPRA